MNIKVDGAVVVLPPNTAPAVEKVWMFVSRDGEGHEHVIAAPIGVLGTQPLVTANEKTMELMKPVAQWMADVVRPYGRTLHLLEFTTRREVEAW